MRRVLITALAAAASIAIASPANASVLIADGITYSLTLNSTTNGDKTGNFTLAISGINGASDTEKGRTGINGFAFNDAATATSGTSTGFTFQLGGLDSSGCNGKGTGFFCFKDTSALFPSPLPSAMSLNFNVTSSTAGVWENWTPDFKIDWVGSKNNYDLVSLSIPLNTNPVPEPSTWAMMLVGFGGIGMAMRRRRRNATLMQIA